MGYNPDEFDRRVSQFKCMQLPGQPMMMHQGTSSLIDDLWAEVKKLRVELEESKSREAM